MTLQTRGGACDTVSLSTILLMPVVSCLLVVYKNFRVDPVSVLFISISLSVDITGLKKLTFLRDESYFFTPSSYSVKQTHIFLPLKNFNSRFL